MLTTQELIEKAVHNLLQPYVEKNIDRRFEFAVHCQQDEKDCKIEVTGYYQNEYNPDEQKPFVLLRMFLYDEWEQAQITNIFLPEFMRYHGLGKNIIYNVFTILEKIQYKLFLVDMVPSFYVRMIQRGAIPCRECDDAVQIVKETRLIESQDKAMSTT